MISIVYLMVHHLLLVLCFCFLHLEGGQFPCTDDCQVTFVNLKCDSSKKRRRGRKSPTKEVSHITAEFEMEMKEEEASGAMLFSVLSKSTCSEIVSTLSTFVSEIKRGFETKLLQKIC